MNDVDQLCSESRDAANHQAFGVRPVSFVDDRLLEDLSTIRHLRLDRRNDTRFPFAAAVALHLFEAALA